MYSPTLEEFVALAAHGNLIPVTRRLLADVETPLSAYRKIRGPGESFLFESVEGGEHLGRYSFVGCNPRAIVRQEGRRVEVLENGKVVQVYSIAPPGENTPGARASNEDSASSVQGSAATKVRDGLAVVELIM